jgi:nucleoside 2-deoxyribosyltransferase
MTLPRIYLAGPDLFQDLSEAARQGRQDAAARFGFEAWSPGGDAEAHLPADPQEKALAISRGNRAAMDHAQALVANITPFRGPHMDAGTAFEIGYFAAQGKPIVAYTSASGTLADRVRQWSGVAATAEADHAGNLIEDFGWHDNLMVEGVIMNQDFPGLAPRIHSSLDEALLALSEMALLQTTSTSRG